LALPAAFTAPPLPAVPAAFPPPAFELCPALELCPAPELCPALELCPPLELPPPLFCPALEPAGPPSLADEHPQIPHATNVGTTAHVRISILLSIHR